MIILGRFCVADFFLCGIEVWKVFFDEMIAMGFSIEMWRVVVVFYFDLGCLDVRHYIRLVSIRIRIPLNRICMQLYSFVIQS